jgi:hypothetical protein
MGNWVIWIMGRIDLELREFCIVDLRYSEIIYCLRVLVAKFAALSG